MYGSRFKTLFKVTTILHLTIGGTDIEQVTEAKLLGINVDNKMPQNSQIDQMLIKMGRSIAVVKHCKKFMPSWLTKQLDQALVLSQLDYSFCFLVQGNRN